MGLQVIGAGFGRTGTRSLKAALEEIGFGPCEHMVDLLADPARIAPWEAAARRRERGEPIDWPAVLDGQRAAVDWPAAAFWEELADAHPEAKVILTVRNPERWYDSARRTIHATRRFRDSSRFGAPLAVAVGLVAPDVGRVLRLTDRLVWDGTFGGRFGDRAHALRVFRDHVAAVRARLPADRLLVYEVKDGWGPLCAFLGVAPPDRPFPHLNDAAEFRADFRRRFWHGLGFGLAALAGLAAVAAGGGLAAARLGRRERGAGGGRLGR